MSLEPTSVTMIKYATAKCDICGQEIKAKVKHTITGDEELNENILNLEKVYWESGSHICDKCKSKI